MELTDEMVYEIEHDLIGEVSVWGRDSAEDVQKLAFYNEGVHDMAARVAYKIKELHSK